MDSLKQLLGSRLQENVSLSGYTTLKIGGPASYLIEVSDPEELKEVLRLASLVQDGGIPYLLIGGGSNLLISDAGFDGLVIKYQGKGVSVKGKEVTVQAGTELQELVDLSIEHGLVGLHKMTGIPGSVGGAIFGNAGAYGQTIGDHVQKVKGLSVKGEVVTLTKDECGFGYRDSNFSKNGLIILEVTFQLSLGNTAALKTEADQILELRKAKYKPGLLCPGSFFRNMYTKDIPQSALEMIPPREDTFGKTPAYIFLETLGAKGDQLGQIQIAPHHANLFINLGGGTAADFYQLAKKWHTKVREKYGVNLQPEVQLINLPPLDS